MTKEEILKKYAAIYVDDEVESCYTVTDILKAMQLYADQQTAELRAEVERLKAENRNLLNEVCFLKIKFEQQPKAMIDLEKQLNGIKAKKLSDRTIKRMIKVVTKKQKEILSRKYVSQEDMKKEITI